MHHLTELLANPWIFIPLLILFFGEYIPFSKPLWRKIGSILETFGRWFLKHYENDLYTNKSDHIEKKKTSLKLNNFFARILFFLSSAFIVIILELFWELGFKGLMHRVERSRLAPWAENKINAMPNWAVLLLFAAPFVLMEIIGILALGAFVSGYIWLGIVLYLVKVLFFIPVHFILHTGKTQLMAIPWFERRYTIVTKTLEWFKKSQTYIKIHNVTERAKSHLRAIKERFAQTMSLLKKAFEQEDILSVECESIREAILGREIDDDEKQKLYKKFFHCIDRHLKKGRKKLNDSSSVNKDQD